MIPLSKNESLFITYAKAIGIITVLLGHYGWNSMNIYHPYIYHMPLFFLVGGILMKPIKNYHTWFVSLRDNYIFYVVAWYIIIAAISVILDIYFGTKLNPKLSDPGHMNFIPFPIKKNMHNNNLFLVAWFLVAYCLVSIFFKNIITHLKSYSRFWSLTSGLVIGYISISYLSPLYWHDRYWVYNLLCQIGVGYMFMTIGFAVRPYLKLFNSIPIFLITLNIMLSGVGSGVFHRLDMAWSKYPDGFLIHVISSLSGCFGVLFIASFITKSFDSKILKKIGNSTKDIMTMHCLVFVIIDLIMCQMGYYDVVKIRACKHFVKPYLLTVYLTSGLMAPILARQTINKVKIILPTIHPIANIETEHSHIE